MRVYEVQPGDSPASIAAAHAGCPKCARDLIGVNAHKETITYPNGFVTFKNFRAGEKLNLPDKWWTKEFDELPPSYFAALPYADGVTPGKGTLAAPYSEALVAAAKSAFDALNADNIAYIDYCVTVTQPGSAVNSAVHAFKLAWNASQSPPVPINTGNYEYATAKALFDVNGIALQECPARAATPPSPRSTPTHNRPLPGAVTPSKEGLSTGAVVGVSLLGAGAVGGAIYLATRHGRRRARR